MGSRENQHGFIHVILAILILIGVVLAVIISIPLGLDRAYKEQFNKSIFDENSGIAKIQKQLDEKAEKLDKTIAEKKAQLSEVRRQYELRNKPAVTDEDQKPARAALAQPASAPVSVPAQTER